MEDIGLILRGIRENNDMSIREVSILSGLLASDIVKIEKSEDKISFPKLDILCRIYNVSQTEVILEAELKFDPELISRRKNVIADKLNISKTPIVKINARRFGYLPREANAYDLLNS